LEEIIIMKSLFKVLFFGFFIPFATFFWINVLEIKSAPVGLRQTGNTISGHVFSPERRSLYDINVELLDEFSRFISRTRTNGAGRYTFSGVPSGRFRVRILTSGSEFEEQEQEVEIQNFTRQTSTGAIVTSGFENVQRDFYLKKRKTNQPTGAPGTIFVQEIPTKAKEFYQKSQELLTHKNQTEAIKALKSAIEEFPEYYDALERLGTEYIKLQQHEAAQILLSRAVEINQRGYPSWYGLGYALYSLNKAEDGLKAVNKALELNPNSLESLLLSGVTLRKLKLYPQAEKQMIKAKSLAKNPIPEIHWQLALLYAHNLQRYNEAADELELYLKANPETFEAANIKKLIKQFREKAKGSK
jgi:tetratricopeptide (TPR) repeat protein